ncbi:sensor histidine kinase [Spirilliplanes yamanashiensis]|uniref:Signal transduction histidine-protein kinase/phosphatase MprB n=1 Tax=Spirilliplanes yamanashiensis TaxID=42233 RepID=A0A8J3Y7B6_9ACTN|nr:HAMP domain-containing sensor histidine kinase [Spirilliplanes yamanashiensis]MDP9817492.1 signal transduction histidine kinase [Spirilliplanes yamanashiensis]GIJ02855.1 two-component sensor histidine kinase [Spirilliplanes yamanashiensis]
MRRAGLRARVTAGFTAGALGLSAVMALVSYQITRQSLLAEREATAVRAAYYDAAIVREGVGAGARPENISAVLRTLDTGEDRRAVLRRGDVWYARQADTGATGAIPAELQQRAAQGRPVVQRVRADGVAALVVAVPLAPDTVYYEIDSLRELEQTLRVLTLVLTLVAAGTGAAGAGLGWYATRYVLRPLTRVADAAQEIAGGRSDARLDPAAEPDLARLSTSFNHMVDELSARLERDRRFAADVSHELRSPLQTLAAAASVLTRRADRLDERSATAAGLVADEVARFQSLVNDLLELARSDQPARRGPVDVAQLARRVCAEHGVPEDVVTPGSYVWRVDRRRIEQLLGNLLDNAAAYGGGATAVRLAFDGDRGRIEVDDEGPGVSAEDKPVIFDRFVRGRSSGARKDGAGTGLGLALVTRHAAAHGGTVQVLDRPGGGARFRVDLPECAP